MGSRRPSCGEREDGRNHRDTARQGRSRIHWGCGRLVVPRIVSVSHCLIVALQPSDRSTFLVPTHPRRPSICKRHGTRPARGRRKPLVNLHRHNRLCVCHEKSSQRETHRDVSSTARQCRSRREPSVARIADCRFRIADCRLSIVDCRLAFGDWRLAIADWRLAIGDSRGEPWSCREGRRRIVAKKQASRS